MFFNQLKLWKPHIKADQYIYYAPIVNHLNAFYVFGGKIDGDPSNIIGRLNALTLRWAKAGELKLARHGHGAIFNGDVIIIACGYDKFKSESCKINFNDSVTCSVQAPTLDAYKHYPEMFLVPDTFYKDVQLSL